jgi:hypothetical protein
VRFIREKGGLHVRAINLPLPALEPLQMTHRIPSDLGVPRHEAAMSSSSSVARDTPCTVSAAD